MKPIYGLALGLVIACSDDNDSETATQALLVGAPTVLVDLDPTSGAMTFTIENMTQEGGLLFTGDRESGNILRVDPAAPVPAIIGHIPARTDASNGMSVNANAGGVAFNADGDLLIASATFNEVVRLPASGISVSAPGNAETFATGTQGANGIVLDGAGNVYVSGGNTGNIYKVGQEGGAATPWAQIAPSTRSVPPDGFMQSVVANGLAFDQSGDLRVADTARGAIWRISVDDAGNAGTPELVVQDPMLEGVDGIAFDARGRLWGAVNERNALVVITDGDVVQAHKNDITGPLEFPAALVFIGNTGYVVNYDRARRDNVAADGSSAPGIGSSIARFSL